MSGSPNLKQVRSKIGSLSNASYKPGGGDVKIESHKLDWKQNTRVSVSNDAEKKVTSAVFLTEIAYVKSSF